MSDETKKETPGPEAGKPEGAADAGKHVDEGWKQEARRDKEKLAKEGARPRPAMPKPSFELLVVSLAMQARLAMGEFPNPVTRQQEVDLESAKHAIDLLGVLEEKTKGNLAEGEKKVLDDALYDLRMRYIAMSQV
jgi:hypothetical protein